MGMRGVTAFWWLTLDITRTRFMTATGHIANHMSFTLYIVSLDQ